MCKPCDEGTWSSTDSAMDRCQTCRRCKPGQIEMRPCTATQNTLCCPLHNPNCDDTFEEEEFDGRFELIARFNVYWFCICFFSRYLTITPLKHNHPTSHWLCIKFSYMLKKTWKTISVLECSKQSELNLELIY